MPDHVFSAHTADTQEYVPTVFENLITMIPSPTDPSKIIELALWDTAGQEDFDRLRPLSYNDTDVILVVFACNHRPSLLNVQDKVSRVLWNRIWLIAYLPIVLSANPITLLNTTLPHIKLVPHAATPFVSLLAVDIQWHPEMAHFCETVPLLLICTKTDLRSDLQTQSLMAAQGTTPISPAEGEKVAKEIGAKRYLECSAKEGRGVREVFDAAVRESLKGKGGLKRMKKKGCVVL